MNMTAYAKARRVAALKSIESGSRTPRPNGAQTELSSLFPFIKERRADVTSIASVFA